MARRRLSKSRSKSPPPFPETLTDAPRPNRGRFQKGQPGPRLTHGRYSSLTRKAELPEQTVLNAALAERRAAIFDDLGGEAGLSVMARDLVTAYLEQMCVKEFLAGRLLVEGPLSAKGRQRALLTAYLAVSDRVLKLATTLGLSRKTKPAQSIEDFLKTKGDNE